MANMPDGDNVAKKTDFYSKTPKIPAKTLADKNPIEGPTLGTMVLAITPAHPGHMKGTGMLQRPIPHPYVKGSHGWGHVAKEKAGHLRLSGHVSAHQIGKYKKYKPTGP